MKMFTSFPFLPTGNGEHVVGRYHKKIPLSRSASSIRYTRSTVTAILHDIDQTFICSFPHWLTKRPTRAFTATSLRSELEPQRLLVQLRGKQ